MNKGKRQLKYFSLIGILLLGISVILLFSYLIYGSFSKGVNASTWVTMSELAKVEGVSNGYPISFSSFSVASSWQDTPIIIQNKFSQTAIKLNDIKVITNNKHIFELPSEIYAVSLFANEVGQQRFVSHVAKLDISGISYGLQLLIVVAFAILSFSCIVVATVSYQRNSIKKLRDWAESIAADDLQQAPPSFHYHELNTLAAIILASFKSVQKTLMRERHFLRNVSHELRTPIAVIDSNLSLLNKMKQANKPAEQQEVVFGRITRANSSMLHITETLLWLNREEDRAVSYITLRLDELVESIDSSLRYLLQGKDVSVQLDTVQSELRLPVGGCHIVIAILLRNAFQHTDHGTVDIKHGAHFIRIRNVNVDFNNKQHETPISFGIGLKLVKKLSKQFGWEYNYVIEESGYYVEVSF